MRKQKITVLILMITLCLTGIWGMKKNTTVWGAVIRVNDVIVPKDIPAVAVEINKSSELITEKLSRVFYTVYTDTDTLHIPVFWDVSSVNMKLAGVYTMKGVLKLPPEYAFDESESLQVQTTVSVQYPDKPDINIYYRLTAAGIYIFPWLKQENFDSMEAYLKKESGQWINLTEEGFALCEEEGLYVSNQSMVVGNTYSLLVTYDNGRKQTNTLRFQYQKDGSLKIYGYQHSLLGNTQKPGKIICSYDTGDEKYLSRCAAYAVKTGGSLKQIEKELKENVRLRVSTAETFENTAENPELVLESSWDLSQVNREKQGVYKVTGSFVIPEGYEVSDSLTLPEAYAYLSVQKKGEPQINTYSMPTVDLLNFRKIDDDLVEVTSDGIQIYYREILKKGQNYQICAVYEKGSTGIYSFSYNDAFIVNEYWHERNFSDREEKDLPDIVQKAPASSEVVQEEKKENLNTGSAGYHYGDSYGTDNNTDGQNSSSNKASDAKSAEISDTENSVTELSTDTITAVSGKRMLLMIQQNGSARFEKQGISVTFSPDTVNGWKINAEDEIQIGIEKTSETAFSLRIFVRGEEVTEVPGTVVEFQTSVFGGIHQYAVNYQEKQNVLCMEINQTGDYFLTDGKSESIGNQTDEESVKAISDGEDIGFTEEPMPEEETEQKTEQKTENSAKQFLMIILTLPAVCILVAAIIFAIRKKRR